MQVAEMGDDREAALAALLSGGEPPSRVPEIPSGELESWIERELPFVVRRHPDVVRGCAALNAEALRNTLGDREIVVEHKHRWIRERRTVSAADYLDSLAETEFYWRQVSLPPLGIVPPPLPGPGGRGDVVFFDHAWIGPGGTVQTFHQDNHDELIVNHNLFMQFQGMKYVALASTEDSAVFHASPLVQGSVRHSSVSPYDAAFRSACPTFSHTVVGPGDVIHIPPRFWHYVEGLTPSVSVSRWWFASRIVETVFLAGTGGVLPSAGRPLGVEAWRRDLSEIGGSGTLSSFLRHLQPSQSYAIMQALVRTYGAGVIPDP